MLRFLFALPRNLIMSCLMRVWDTKERNVPFLEQRRVMMKVTWRQLIEYVVVQFYPWFNFYFSFHGFKLITSPYTKTKGNKFWTKDHVKIEPQHIYQWHSECRAQYFFDGLCLALQLGNLYYCVGLTDNCFNLTLYCWMNGDRFHDQINSS